METQHFSLAVDAQVPNGLTNEEVLNIIALAVQGVMVNHGILSTKVEAIVGKFKPGTSGKPTAAKGKPGRKPVNRPKVEAWIRANVQVGESTQGTTGLNGVDRSGMPLIDSPNKIYAHRIAAPEEAGGVGLSMLAIKNVLSQLETEGYLEKGFSSGADWWEYVRELHPEGYEGAGVPIQRASIREIDFTFAHIPEGKDQPSGVKPALIQLED